MQRIISLFFEQISLLFPRRYLFKMYSPKSKWGICNSKKERRGYRIITLTWFLQIACHDARVRVESSHSGWKLEQETFHFHWKHFSQPESEPACGWFYRNWTFIKLQGQNVKCGCRKDTVQSPGSLNCNGCSCFREQHSPCSDRDVIFFVAALYWCPLNAPQGGD